MIQAKSVKETTVDYDNRMVKGIHITFSDESELIYLIQEHNFLLTLYNNYQNGKDKKI